MTLRPFGIGLLLLLAAYFAVMPGQAQAQSGGGAAAAAGGPCGADGFPLFSCALPAQASFAFCMAAQTLEPSVVWTDPSGAVTRSPAHDLKQAVFGPSSRGVTVVTAAQTDFGEFALFVDTDAGDMANPAITVASGGRRQAEFCLPGSAHVAINTVVIEGRDRLVDLTTLLRLRIAHRLMQVPRWPDEDDAAGPEKQRSAR